MAKKNSIFALLTDFGLDFAVASMKALLLKEVPDASIIDIDHSITKFSIMSGAFILEKVYCYFPHGSIFICIIDPGVGSQREALCVRHAGYTFFGPNNGLFRAILKQEDAEVFCINEEIIKPASYTFHGRDLFAPAATRYAQGITTFLKPWDDTKQKLIYSLEKNGNFITYIDSFGNIKTNLVVDASFSDRILHIKIGDRDHHIPFLKTFSQTPSGALLCYKGSNETLEIAVNLGSAQDHLQAHVGDTITLVTLL
jgi:S-adenosyl-L-methionine hydrolase (adenosine-forming)